jgi:hypothetical protein
MPETRLVQRCVPKSGELLRRKIVRNFAEPSRHRASGLSRRALKRDYEFPERETSAFLSNIVWQRILSGSFRI